MKLSWNDIIKISIGTVLGVFAKLAFSDVSPNIAPSIRYYVGILLVLLCVWLVFPFLFAFLYMICLGGIAAVETFILKTLLNKYPNSHIVRLSLDENYKNVTIYAATAFVYKKGSIPPLLIWVHHKTHDELLPPGGRLLWNELPHNAVKTRVSAETGIPLEHLHFSNFFVNNYTAHTNGSPGIVTSHPLPIVIQQENVEQKGGLPFHYDFIYLLETDFQGALKGKEGQNPQWLDVSSLRFAPPKRAIEFGNIRLLAEVIYARLANGENGPLEKPTP